MCQGYWAKVMILYQCVSLETLLTPLLPYVMNEFPNGGSTSGHLACIRKIVHYLHQGWSLKEHFVLSKAGLNFLDVLSI